MAKGAGKEEASASVMQPQGAGGVAAGARWGRAVAEGRTRRLMVEEAMMVVERRRGREEKEEGRRRREEERWSRMEGCGGETASGASLQLHLGGSLSLSLSLSAVTTLPPHNRQVMSFFNTPARLQKCHSPKHLDSLLSGPDDPINSAKPHVFSFISTRNPHSGALGAREVGDRCKHDPSNPQSLVLSVLPPAPAVIVPSLSYSSMIMVSPS